MLYTYKELENKLGSFYKFTLAIKNKEYFKVEKGIYSDNKYINGIELITKKYPNAIFTMDSAFYFYNLTDVIPEKKHLAIQYKRKKISGKDIDLYYTSEKFFELGKTILKTHNTIINIYDREKMLIELVRNKKTIGYDYYKEIINNYREIADELDSRKIEDYTNYYSNGNSIFETICHEVF